MRFCLITIQGDADIVATGSAEFGWLLHRLDELGEPGRLVQLSADDLLIFNPSSKTSPVFTSTKDVEISRRIYSHGEHVMLDEQKRIGRIDFLGELFNMTRDSGLFLKEPHGESLPLYEAKFIHQFDHRFAEYLSDNVAELPGSSKSDPSRSITPKSFVEARKVRERLSKRSISTRWLCGFRDIASATNERTAIVAVFPLSAVGNSINMVLDLSAVDTACFVANANSFTFDYCCRQKLSGTHVNIWIFKQLPAIPLGVYGEPCVWAGQPAITLRNWLLPRVLELTYTAWDLESFALECGWFGPPFVSDEARRFQIRCELDASFLHLYGLSRADAAYILDTFSIVRRKDEATYGSYRTRDTILEHFDELSRCTAEGHTFTNAALALPPADPRAAHEPRLPSTPRAAYAGKTYFETVLPLLLRMAPDGLETAQLFHAMALLTDRKLRAAEAACHLGVRGGEWTDAFREPYRWEDAAAALIGEIAKHRIRGVTRVRLASDAAVVESDPWLVFDAFMTLRLALSAEQALELVMN